MNATPSPSPALATEMTNNCVRTVDECADAIRSTPIGRRFLILADARTPSGVLTVVWGKWSDLPIRIDPLAPSHFRCVDIIRAPALSEACRELGCAIALVEKMKAPGAFTADVSNLRVEAIDPILKPRIVAASEMIQALARVFTAN